MIWFKTGQIKLRSLKFCTDFGDCVLVSTFLRPPTAEESPFRMRAMSAGDWYNRNVKLCREQRLADKKFWSI